MEEESYEVILVMLLLAPFMTDMPTLRLAVVEFRIVLFFASGPSTAMPVPVAESRMVRLEKVLFSAEAAMPSISSEIPLLFQKVRLKPREWLVALMRTAAM